MNIGLILIFAGVILLFKHIYDKLRARMKATQAKTEQPAH